LGFVILPETFNYNETTIIGSSKKVKFFSYSFIFKVNENKFSSFKIRIYGRPISKGLFDHALDVATSTNNKLLNITII
jgi:hypothetical protein